MKVKNIVLAIAAALVAPVAFAAPADLGTVPAANVFYISGASAQTPGLAKTLVAFCAGTVETYSVGTSASNSFIYYCPSAKATTTSAVSTGFTAGAKFLVAKMDQGGSFNGVAPVAPTGSLAGFPAFGNINSCTTSTTVALNAGVIAGTYAGNCANGTAGAIRPQIGLSDVPKSIWAGRGQLNATDNANLNAIGGFAGQGFGVAVSKALLNDLQRDQGLVVDGAGQANVPSLSTNQYAALVQAKADGGVWDILFPNSAKAVAAGNAALTAAWPPASTLTLHRRQNTSGTQASSDAYFLNNPCLSSSTLGGAIAPTAGSATADTAATYADTAFYTSTVNFLVNERSSTGNVRTGLAAAGYALGVLSLENLEANIGGGAKYVKLDGVSPTVDAVQKANLVNGSYDFAYELELLTAKPAAANVAALATALSKELANGNVGIAGLYSDPNAGFLIEGETNHYTRGNNACRKATWFW